MEPYNVLPPSEDVYLGTPDGRFLSPVRRFFCLLVTFDFLFTVLLWTLCVILMKDPSVSITNALKDEVLHYSLYTSIFDTVMCALSRFTVLILFYAILRCDTVLPVALTTTASCAFLLTKVFLFTWPPNATYTVMLILCSFILSWSESWFLDFRVVPQERQAAMYHARHQQVLGSGRGLIPWLGHSVSQIARSSPGGTFSYPESIANFYSPLESPLHSDEENDLDPENMERRLSRQRSENPEVRVWMQQAPQMVDDLVKRIDSTCWTPDKTVDGFAVYNSKSSRKIFLITGSLPTASKIVAEELFNNFEAMPTWNSNVKHCEILQRLDSCTDVSYQISRGGGPVSPRDFVTLRHMSTNSPDSIVIAAVSVKHASKPANLPKLTRGFNGLSGWTVKEAAGDLTCSEFRWLLDIDLSMPSMFSGIVDKAIVNAAIETLKFFRQRLEFQALNQPESASRDAVIFPR